MTSETSLGIFTTDRDLIIRSWDEWLTRTTGVLPAETIGNHLRRVIPDLETRGLDSFFRRSLEEGVIEILAPRFHSHLIACSPTKPSRRFDRMQQKVTIAPLKDEDSTIGLIVTVEDVTERLDRERDSTLLETFDEENWATRRRATDEMSLAGSEQAVTTLLRLLRSQHRNINVLNSALKVLAGSGLDTVKPLTELLKDSDPELRMYAALALGNSRSRAATMPLIGLLDDPDVNVRYHAIEALARIKSPEAANRLLQLAESDDFFLAFPAIDALAQLDDPEIAVRLAPLLQNEMVRTAVVEALGTLGDEKVVPSLVALLDRPGPQALSVSHALVTLHDRYERRFNEGAFIADLVRQHAPAGAARVLMEAMNEVDAKHLREIVRFLGWFGQVDVAPGLTRLLGSQVVRKEVIEALVRHGKGVTHALEQQLENDDSEACKSAIIALGRVGDPDSVPALVRKLRTAPDNDNDLKVAIAAALSKLGDSRGYQALITLLGDGNASVRQAAIGGINSLGDPRTSADVLRMISDTNPNTRESAVRIAGYFGYHPSRLIACATDSDENVRRAAIETLAYLDDRRVLPILVRALREEAPRIRAAAALALGHRDEPQVIGELIAALDDNEIWVRYYAARSLGLVATPEALDRLALVVKSDPAVHVRIAAAEALASIGGAKAVAVLSTLLDSQERDLSQAAATALGSIGHPAALPPLMEMLRSSERDRRLAAVNAFKARSDSEVVQALEWTAATDKDGEVANVALDKLAAMATPEALSSVVRLTAQPALREPCIAALSRVDEANMEIVAQGLTHPQKEVRYSVIDALSRKKHPIASDLLTRALEDDDAEVRFAAVIAFTRLGSHTAERKLAFMVASDSDPAVRSAAKKALER